MGDPCSRPLGPSALHFCVDMQRSVLDGGPWPTPWMERVLPVIVAIAERAPEKTIFTRFIPPMRPEDMPGTWRLYYEKWEEATRQRSDPAFSNLMPPLQRLVPPAHLRQTGLLGFCRTSPVGGPSTPECRHADCDGLGDGCVRPVYRLGRRRSRLSRGAGVRWLVQFLRRRP